MLFLLIVYFSGFATAIYYLSPNGRSGSDASPSAYSSDGKESKAVAVLSSLRDNAYGKVAAGFAGMDQQEFKAAFDRGMQAIMSMSKGGQTTAEEQGGK